MEWDDPALETATTRMVDWYKCAMGHRDVIRVVSSPEKIMRHSWQDGGQWNARQCSMREHGKCPYCDALRGRAGAKYDERWGLTILHLTRAMKGAKPTFIGRLLAWRFDDKIKNQLLEIHNMTGKRIRLVDLQVVLRVGREGEANAEKFQNVDIHKLDEAIFDRLKDKFRAQLQKLIEDKSKAIRLLYLPTPEMLEQGIKTDLKATEFNPQEYEPEKIEFEEPEEKKPVPPKKEKNLKPMPKEKKEDALDVDDPLAGLDDLASNSDLGDTIAGDELSDAIGDHDAFGQ